MRIAVPRVSVGLATLAPRPPLGVERQELPGATRRQRFHLLVTRFPVSGRPGDSGELVVANLHLSAFDRGAAVRGQQLAAVTAFMLAEAGQGASVVLGGDWNLLLADPGFPHAAEERYLTWIHPLPKGFPPPGWGLAVDPAVPTVRTPHRPYTPGVNYTGIIDGFEVSPDAHAMHCPKYSDFESEQELREIAREAQASCQAQWTLSLRRLAAQSRRYRLIRFWYGMPRSMARALK